LAVVVLGAGWQLWHRYHVVEPPALARSAIGFVKLPLPDGMDADSVVVFSPEDCPSEAAQRADALVSSLESKHISVVRAHEASFDVRDQQTADQVNSVMEGPIPVVFVRGKAKANPSVEEVIAEFQAHSPR
jgi:signal recognition particle receptor subunit beta